MYSKKKILRVGASILGVVFILYFVVILFFSTAVSKGNYKIVERMLSWGISVDIKDPASKTPLMEAADNGQLEIIKLLIDHNANVNATNRDGWSAILFAADYGNEFVTQALIDAGANVNVADKDGYTPVMWAASEGHRQTVKLLVKHKANVNTKCQYPFLEGYTPLLFAIDANSPIICEELIKAGANVNDMDNSGWLPITAATHKGNLKIVQLLIESGAYYKFSGEDAPFEIAKRKGHDDIVDYLIGIGLE